MNKRQATWVFFRHPWGRHYLAFKWRNTAFPSLSHYKVDNTAHLPIFSEQLQETLRTHFTLPRWNFWTQRVLHVVHCIIIWMPSVGLGDFGCSNCLAMFRVYLYLILGWTYSLVSASIRETSSCVPKMNWRPSGFLSCSSGFLTLAELHWKKACLEPSSWGCVKAAECYPFKDESCSLPFKLHWKSCSQSCVSLDVLRKLLIHCVLPRKEVHTWEPRELCDTLELK